MASINTFVDTSGFFALLAKPDPAHLLAANWLQKARSANHISITTDYVLSETATLLKARRRADLVIPFFQLITSSSALRIEWMSQNRFEKTREYFLRHNDHGYSFADCTSFVVMNEFKLTEALTTDKHFQEAGFLPVLPLK
ncbi:MAG: uncharacterized protein QOD03_1407 [Verrucomicrobiota bacterium]|jgi:predicted nucleic acid-binding protein